MDFAEDYRCHLQEEIQLAYWSQTQVLIGPVVAYFKRNDMVHYQSFAFIPDEHLGMMPNLFVRSFAYLCHN